MKHIVWLNFAWQWRYLTDKNGFPFYWGHTVFAQRLYLNDFVVVVRMDTELRCQQKKNHVEVRPQKNLNDPPPPQQKKNWTTIPKISSNSDLWKRILHVEIKMTFYRNWCTKGLWTSENRRIEWRWTIKVRWNPIWIMASVFIAPPFVSIRVMLFVQA